MSWKLFKNAIHATMKRTINMTARQGNEAANNWFVKRREYFADLSEAIKILPDR